MTARESLNIATASQPPWDGFNLGNHVGDDLADVLKHRAELAAALQAQPVWLQQVHGHRVVRLTQANAGALAETQADGVFTTEPGLVCAIMVADCLPILLVAPEGRGVAALHAGWRGLAGAGDLNGLGIADAGVAALCEATSSDPADLQVWLGPCIGPTAFQVGVDVLTGFGVDPTQDHHRFVRQSPDRWLADLAGLAADRLQSVGLKRIEGGQWCTVSEPSRFFSFRRDRVTGRQAACIWLDGA
ncbi:MAG: peptidoglycan editing factor PgeF [Aquabacterium sp.]|uniref:peptidoglycan editing factor PgeF n=1 Tax=Aquabacterium sp. TaxID=1872578 RepID=UPI0027225BC4|nr:peptidoglycan editing factor PgeF [Aquabacterium sp.]MDO9004537.1 peptidoglycan editing factor PgeF [Aquabacterium sp.]